MPLCHGTPRPGAVGVHRRSSVRAASRSAGAVTLRYHEGQHARQVGHRTHRCSGLWLCVVVATQPPPPTRHGGAPRRCREYGKQPYLHAPSLLPCLAAQLQPPTLRETAAPPLSSPPPSPQPRTTTPSLPAPLTSPLSPQPQNDNTLSLPAPLTSPPSPQPQNDNTLSLCQPLLVITQTPTHPHATCACTSVKQKQEPKRERLADLTRSTPTTTHTENECMHAWLPAFTSAA